MTARKQQYLTHLDSAYWKRVRLIVLERDGGRCLVCNGKERLQAHHRTYQNFGRELEHLADVSTLCEECHSTFHTEKKRARKAKRGARIPRRKMPLACFLDELDQHA